MSKTRIVSQDIGDASITDADIAAANKDGTSGTASLRTLGAGAAQATAGNDSRLTESGTHVADTSAAHAAASIAFTPNGSIGSTDVQAAIQEVRDEAAGGGAPSTSDYLVGTADGGLSAEIVVGTAPGGELGGTWASPTVDATHSGSAHHTESHASRHASAGADAVKLDDLAATDDNTDLDASASAHGLLLKLGGGSTNYLRADGTWAAPSGAGAPSSVDYLVGTADGGLSAEIVVGTSPGGELGGTWASPTVDATHSGSPHVTGHQIIAAPMGFSGPVATNNTTPAVNAAYLTPIYIGSPMYVHSVYTHMQAASSGTWTGGLFDFTASVTAATKLVAFSGTLNGTGLQAIAATGAPVLVQPGGYALIMLAPAANSGSMYRSQTVSSLLARSQASYAWDDTPDLSTGWANTTNFYQWFLVGDLSGSAAW